MNHRRIAGDPASGLLVIVDHASNAVPTDVELGVAPALLVDHVAWDIGAAPLAEALCARVDAPAILGGVSRLVIDLNREEDAPALIPISSDGHAIPGNAGLSHAERETRIARFWRPYHEMISGIIVESNPKLLISLHSFTPHLAAHPAQERPWQIGVLYNEDDRAARIAIPLLEAAGVRVGDQLPYSGKALNATMNRHGETNALPYLGLEVRQDLISSAAGVEEWADILAPVIVQCRNTLAPAELFAT